jgi:hypothetical protein
LREAQVRERTIDGENAFASLVEGDATLAMFGWVIESQGQRLSTLTRNPSVLRDILASAPRVAGGAELDRAPAIVRAPLISRYLDGLVFCAYLHGQGGFRWIDEAFADPPISTEQILHPERWRAHELPDPIEMPAFPELDAAGLRTHEQDTLGELELSIYLGRQSGQERDATAGEGWSGDVIRVYVREDRSTAAVWFSAWDDERQAQEAVLAASRVRDAVPAERAADHRVEKSGRALLILRDLEPALHAAVLDDFERFARALPPRRGPPAGR